MKDLITKFAITQPGTGNLNQTGIDTVGEGVGTQHDSFINTVTSILNGIIAVLGLVCVVVIIIGGVNYMTSSGDTGKVKKAKDTILYGLIGLAVCVLAFALVNFVIVNIIGGTN